MRLVPKQIEIPPDNPFANDLLGRKKAADALTELVNSGNAPLVLSIQAPWGEGKTTFLQMWQAQLRLLGVPTVCFSAWEHDYTDDPLIALIGEIELQLASTGAGKSRKRRFDTAKKFGVKFLKATLPTAVKVASAGLLDLKSFTEESIAQLGEEITRARIADYEAAQKSLYAFRQALASFAEDLGVRPSGDKYPLVVMIDELDRCRPAYAIQLLERIKHLFSVPGTVHVLGVDRRQLTSLVASCYGAQIDADGYLRRFFDLEFRLPDPPLDAFCKAQFARYELEDFFKARVEGELRYERNQAEETMTALFAETACSLRDQERCFSLLSLAIRTTQAKHFLYPVLLCALIVLKVKRPGLYDAFTAGRMQPKDVMSELTKTAHGKKFVAEGYGSALEAHLVACRASRIGRDAEVQAYASAATSEASKDEEREHAKKILEVLQDFHFTRTAYGILDYMKAKIDLISSLQTN